MSNSRTAFPCLVASVFLCACAPHDEPIALDYGCDNAELTVFDGLLILAPHPDGEILGGVY